MARGTLGGLIGLCLALAVTAQSATSTQHLPTKTLPQSSQAATRETSLSAAPGHSTAPGQSTTASTQEAAPTSSRNPESTSAPSLSQTSTLATPAASSSETHATDLPRNTSTSVAPAAGFPKTHVTDRPGSTNSTTISSSASLRPGSETALHTTEAAPSPEQPSLSQSPGLVVVICIFVAILLLATVLIAVKFCHRREPAFKKLDEVPMGKMTEDSPFARYPPK